MQYLLKRNNLHVKCFFVIIIIHYSVNKLKSKHSYILISIIIYATATISKLKLW